MTTAAAAAASEQAGKEGDGTVGQVQPLGAFLAAADDVWNIQSGNTALTLSHRLPERIVHDPQMRNLGPDPFAFRVHPRYARAGLGVLDEAVPVPCENPGIEFIVEDAGPDDRIAANGGVDPRTVSETGDALPVQLERDLLRASAAGIFAEDAAHDLGFFLDNRPLAPDRLAVGVELVDGAIAVGSPSAARLSGFHAPALAAMGLDGEIFYKQRIHGAFQADMKLVDLALGQGDDGNARKAQALIDGGHVLLIAADAVKRLGQHHVETARLRVGQKGPDTGAEHGGPGDGAVGPGLHHGPAFVLGAFAALAQLVLNGGVALVLGGIAGVKSNADHGVGSCRSGLSLQGVGFAHPRIVGWEILGITGHK